MTPERSVVTGPAPGIAWLGAFAVGLAHAQLDRDACIASLVEAAGGSPPSLRSAQARVADLHMADPQLRRRAERLLRAAAARCDPSRGLAPAEPGLA